jgi:hypothetical protein
MNEKEEAIKRGDLGLCVQQQQRESFGNLSMTRGALGSTPRGEGTESNNLQMYKISLGQSTVNLSGDMSLFTKGVWGVKEQTLLLCRLHCESSVSSYPQSCY